MHSNSLEALATVPIPEREHQVLKALYSIFPLPASDRELSRLAGLEITSTRPRCTNMLAKGLLAEIGSTNEPESRSRVRLVQLTAKGRAALERVTT